MATSGGSPPVSVMACWFRVTTARLPRVMAASRAHFSSAEPASAKTVRRSSVLKTPTCCDPSRRGGFVKKSER